MRTPTATELLQLWESGSALAPAERALALLALAVPELGYEGAARCSIGGRDELLLALRERLFGDELVSVTHCPDCDTAIESRWCAAQLRASLLRPAMPVLELRQQQLRIVYRLPNTEDMLALPAGDTVEGHRQRLLSRCITAAEHNGKPVTLAALPESALAALEAAMAVADPMADIDMTIQCPACQHASQRCFDVVSFLWSELHAWAQRLLLEVHKLARAYGWSEPQILALSPGRRMLYVEMSAS
jgi:hypothetical protein